mgnify:CR=1 FL=1
MNTFTDWILAYLTAHGALTLLLIAYIGSLGIPFPLTAVLIAAGAFSRLGILDWRIALAACLVGSALADNSEYILGRTARHWLSKRFGNKSVWLQAHSIIQRQGGWAILLTRFWLTPLAPAINMIAGGRYPYLHFLFFDLLGEFLWVLIYGGLGYLFAAQWQQVNQAVSGFSMLSMALTFLVFGVYFLFQRRRKHVSIS